MPSLQVKAESGCKKLNMKYLHDTFIYQPNENLAISYPAFFFFFTSPSLSKLLWQILFPVSQAIRGLFVKLISSCSIYLMGTLGNNLAEADFIFSAIKMTTFSFFFPSQCVKGDLEYSEVYSDFTGGSPGMQKKLEAFLPPLPNREGTDACFIILCLRNPKNA